MKITHIGTGMRTEDIEIMPNIHLFSGTIQYYAVYPVKKNNPRIVVKCSNFSASKLDMYVFDKILDETKSICSQYVYYTKESIFDACMRWAREAWENKIKAMRDLLKEDLNNMQKNQKNAIHSFLNSMECRDKKGIESVEDIEGIVKEENSEYDKLIKELKITRDMRISILSSYKEEDEEELYHLMTIEA